MSKPLQPQSRRDTEIDRRPVLGSATRNDDLTGKIIGCAIEIHRHLGPVLLESIYESALAAQLELQGIRYKRQIEICINYRGRVIGAHKLDFIVENAVVLELKSVERFDPVFEAQVLTYMRIAKLTSIPLYCMKASRDLFFEICFSVPLWLSG